MVQGTRARQNLAVKQAHKQMKQCHAAGPRGRLHKAQTLPWSLIDATCPDPSPEHDRHWGIFADWMTASPGPSQEMDCSLICCSRWTSAKRVLFLLTPLKNRLSRPGGTLWFQACRPSACRQRLEDCYKFKASLGYIEIFRIVRVIQWEEEKEERGRWRKGRGR